MTHLSINLDKIETSADWGETVGELIRDEIRRELLSIVRAEVKQSRKRLEAEVAKVTNDVLKDLKSARIREISAKMLEELR